MGNHYQPSGIKTPARSMLLIDCQLQLLNSEEDTPNVPELR